MNPERKPKQVVAAQLKYDREALSRMGRKGNEVKQKKREFKRRENDVREVKSIEEAQRIEKEQAMLGTISAEGDVLPPDPEVLSSLEEQ